MKKYEVVSFFWSMETEATSPENAIREAFRKRLPHIEPDRFNSEVMKVLLLTSDTSCPQRIIHKFHVCLTSWNAMTVIERLNEDI